VRLIVQMEARSLWVEKGQRALDCLMVEANSYMSGKWRQMAGDANEALRGIDSSSIHSK
jgi:hypothetical protein